jgi:hypothetical protein
MYVKDNIKDNLLITSVTKNDVKVIIAIDFDNDRISLVNYDRENNQFDIKKYIFAQCGTEREDLWLNVLDAQKEAIRHGMKLLKEFNKVHRKLPF